MKLNRLPNCGTSKNWHQRFSLKSNGTILPLSVYGRNKVVAGSANGFRLVSSLGNGKKPVNSSLATSSRAMPTGLYCPPVESQTLHQRAWSLAAYRPEEGKGVLYGQAMTLPVSVCVSHLMTPVLPRSKRKMC